MNAATLRAWTAHRQGLDGRLDGESPAGVLEEAGWVRSVGGATPYLALHARAGLSREAIDAAVAAETIHELPAARGCTYVVPAADYAVALASGRAFGGVTERRAAEKLGVTKSEVSRLHEAVLEALRAGPLEPRALQQATGGAVRSLGDDGRKRGLSTTLPLALGDLQSAGRIRRVPVNGRLDQQRYAYSLWEPGPFAGSDLGDAEAYVELARRYFRWAAPATPADFQWFSGLGKRAAAEAMAGLDLAPLGPEDPRLIGAEDLDALRSFAPPAEPRYVLVGSLDNVAHLRRDAQALVDPAGARFLESGSTPGNLADLPHHAILDRGRLVGMWDYDTASSSIVWASFGPTDAALRDAVRRTEAFVRDELGDARSFSLDGPATRGARLEALRAMGR